MRTLRLALLVFLIAGCAKQETTTTNGGGAPSNAGSASNLTINGAGATFPYPIYSKWFSEYGKKHPNIQINYQSIGSGGGIKQMSASVWPVNFSCALTPGML